jgi:uncharacterized protein (TIGR04141 family)
MAKSASAVLLVPAGGRYLALAFGQGRFLLANDCWEERFGLKVVLNSVNQNSLRSIDKQTFDAVQKQSREQASHNASAFDFGFDIERDLLRAVTGIPDDAATLGHILTGMDALKAHLSVDLAQIDIPLNSCLRKYAEDSYKNTFPWVDHIAPVKSKETIARLDQMLRSRSPSFRAYLYGIQCDA